MDTRPVTRADGPTHGPTLEPVPDPSPPATVTTSALADELTTSSANLRKWCRRRNLLPEPAGPGLPIVFEQHQADAVREAWAQERQEGSTRTRPVTRDDGSTPEPDPYPYPTRNPSPRVDPGSDPVDPAEPWRRLVAEVTAERDRGRAELATMRERWHQAEQRAEEAERGRHVAEQRVADLRAAWYRWRFALSRLSLLRRLRGYLPPEPAELTAGAALAPPSEP